MSSITTLPVDLVHNLIGVQLGADQRLLHEAQKTAAENKDALSKAKSALEEQAKEIDALKARLVQVEAVKEQLVTVYKAENHALAATNAQLSHRVIYLEGDVRDRQNLLDIYNGKLHEAKYVLGNLCKGHNYHSDVGRRNWADAHRVANS